MVFPEEFLRRMEEMLGEEYPAFAASLEKDKVQGLRANPLKIQPEPLAGLLPFPVKPVPWTAEGFYYDAADRPGRHPYHDAGLYYMQEPSAMSAVETLDIRPGQRVLDLCAAPGGKSSQIAGRMLGQGILVSNEIIPGRAKILAQNLERMGVSNVVILNEESGKLASRLPEFFDRILVDAPCSGEGMFRKDPEACKEWSPENVDMCARRQLKILQNAAAMLKPGGRLVYSTCTFSPAENEQTVEALLKAVPSLSLTDTGISAFFSPGRREWCSGSAPVEKTVRVWPHLTNGEGHFVAAFEKAAEGYFSPEPALKFSVPTDAEALFLQFCEETLTTLGQSLTAGPKMLMGSELYRLPTGAFPLDGLRVIRPGLHLGSCRKGRFEPSHSLAMALPGVAVQRSVSFTPDQPETLAFLRGETLNLDRPKGWLTVQVDGYPLGWAKSAGGTLKNHYPKGLRRMG